MALDADPYRTLGLARGATLDEVKRAYRRLAKANHPDAAGSGGLARFLAIQAAYEQLVEGSAGPAGSPSRGPRRASAADPDRADATRRAYGGRARARRSAGGEDGPNRPGPASGEKRQRGRGDGDPGGPAGPGPASRERPGEGDRPGERGAESGRRRGKATLGSTSYDDANPGLTEPDWSGASWYGTTSGTYWTINPKEYADPRKHGPEYQARARRAADPRTLGGSAARAETAAADAGPIAGADARRAGPIDEPVAGWRSTGEPSAPLADAGRGPAARRPVDPSPPAPDEPAPDPGRALAILARALTDPRAGGPRGRVVRAFVGWLPVALGIGWALGEITGCGRFAATCDPSVGPLILLLQGAALVGLLVTPSLASLAAAAALGLLVAAVAATLVLSATGTAADDASRRATLGLLLVIAWLAGLAIAIAQRVGAASSRAGPVS
jgi:hypothetical protein